MGCHGHSARKVTWGGAAAGTGMVKHVRGVGKAAVPRRPMHIGSDFSASGTLVVVFKMGEEGP